MKIIIALNASSPLEAADAIKHLLAKAQESIQGDVKIEMSITGKSAILLSGQEWDYQSAPSVDALPGMKISPCLSRLRLLIPTESCPGAASIMQIAESLVSSAERAPGTEVPVPLDNDIPPHKILAQAQKIAIQRGLAERYVSFYTASGASVLVTAEV